MTPDDSAPDIDIDTDAGDSRPATDDRLARLEALADRQRERIEENWERIRAQRERIAELEADHDPGSGPGRAGTAAAITRSLAGRLGLAGAGLVGLLAGTGTGTAAGAPDRVGTASDPLSELHTEELDGGLTGGTAVTSLTGNALQTVSTGSGAALITPWVDSDGDNLLELDSSAAASGGIGVSDVEADLLRATDTLPRYSNVGDDPDATLNALQNLFSEPAWDDARYVSGPSHGEGVGAFALSTLVPSGDVVFPPYRSSNVGIYDPVEDSYTSGPTHGETTPAFVDGALAATGEVVFAPYESANVGVYDPVEDTYTSGPAHEEGEFAFVGAVLAATGDVIFVPHNAPNVGIYDPVDDSYTSGPGHGEDGAAFADGVLTHTGEIVFSPYDSPNVGIYDPANDSYTTGPAHGEGTSAAFDGAVLTPGGEVVFAPRQASNVGSYDPVDDSYTSGPAHGEGSDAFSGIALAPTGDVVFAPRGAANVGIYDPADDSYTTGPSRGEGDNVFAGATLTPSGTIVMSPIGETPEGTGVSIGLFDAFSATDNPRSTALHPIVN